MPEKIATLAPILAFALMYPQDLLPQDKSFTSSDVLSWDTESQDWYFETNISMAGIIASQNPTDHAECINDWYFESAETRESAHAEIREVMKQYETHHPGTVVIAVLERVCGSFNFRD